MIAVSGYAHRMILDPTSAAAMACLLMLFALGSVVAIILGARAGRPIFRKGIKGTALENSHALMRIQCYALAVFAVVTGTIGILFAHHALS